MRKILWTCVCMGGILAACRGDPPPPEQPPALGTAPQIAPANTGGSPATQPTAGAPVATPASSGGGNPSMGRVISVCPDNQPISSGDQTTAAGTVFLAYKAALKGDAAFEEFFSLWSPEANREFVRKQIWPRVIQHVSKYVASPTDPTYTLCRSMVTAQNRVKLFVKCNDAQKSDPPIVLMNDGGTWKIDTMTP